MDHIQRHKLNVVATLVPDHTTVIMDTDRRGFQFKHFYVGSVASYAMRNGEDPIAAVKNNIKRGKENTYQDYCNVWIGAHCTVIDNTGRSAAKYAEREAQAVHLKFGDAVCVEGHPYRVVELHNQNVGLEPIGKAMYGQPKILRHKVIR